MPIHINNNWSLLKGRDIPEGKAEQGCIRFALKVSLRHLDLNQSAMNKMFLHPVYPADATKSCNNLSHKAFKHILLSTAPTVIQHKNIEISTGIYTYHRNSVVKYMTEGWQEEECTTKAWMIVDLHLLKGKQVHQLKNHLLKNAALQNKQNDCNDTKMNKLCSRQIQSWQRKKQGHFKVKHKAKPANDRHQSFHNKQKHER